MLTVNQAAERLGWSTGYVRRLCREGRIPGAQRVGRDWLLPEPIILTLPRQETTVRPVTIEEIREAARQGHAEMSEHAEKRSAERRIRPSVLLEALAESEILENYPDDPRGPSALVLAYIKGNAWHAVCGRGVEGALRIITVYEPSMPWWTSDRERNLREEGRASW